MTEETTFQLFQGFTDYSFFYPNPDVIWTIVGTVLLVVTIISYLPQTINLIKNKSSYGLAVFSVLSQATCLWLMTFNVLCLKWSDFVGIFQHLNFHTFARFLTFLNVFSQWILYFPVVILMWVYFDIEPRLKRDFLAIRKERFLYIMLPTIAVGLFFSCVLTWVIVGMVVDFNSNAMKIIGKGAGILSFIIEIIQFIPQVVKTIGLKDNGSLSMLMLEIQAPTNLGNAVFMWKGEHESWTTFAASMADGGWEFVLLGLCLYYKAQRRRRERTISEKSLSEMTSELLGAPI